MADFYVETYEDIYTGGSLPFPPPPPPLNSNIYMLLEGFESELPTMFSTPVNVTYASGRYGGKSVQPNTTTDVPNFTLPANMQFGTSFLVGFSFKLTDVQSSKNIFTLLNGTTAYWNIEINNTDLILTVPTDTGTTQHTITNALAQFPNDEWHTLEFGCFNGGAGNDWIKLTIDNVLKYEELSPLSIGYLPEGYTTVKLQDSTTILVDDFRLEICQDILEPPFRGHQYISMLVPNQDLNTYWTGSAAGLHTSLLTDKSSTTNIHTTALTNTVDEFGISDLDPLVRQPSVVQVEAHANQSTDIATAEIILKRNNVGDIPIDVIDTTERVYKQSFNTDELEGAWTPASINAMAIGVVANMSIDIPSVPQSFNVSNITQNSATLTWSPPLQVGAMNGYRIRYKNGPTAPTQYDGSDGSSLLFDFAVNQTSVQLTGLPQGFTQSFSIWAKTATGDHSELYKSVTLTTSVAVSLSLSGGTTINPGQQATLTAVPTATPSVPTNATINFKNSAGTQVGSDSLSPWNYTTPTTLTTTTVYTANFPEQTISGVKYLAANSGSQTVTVRTKSYGTIDYLADYDKTSPGPWGNWRYMSSSSYLQQRTPFQLHQNAYIYRIDMAVAGYCGCQPGYSDPSGNGWVKPFLVDTLYSSNWIIIPPSSTWYPTPMYSFSIPDRYITAGITYNLGFDRSQSGYTQWTTYDGVSGNVLWKIYYWWYA